MREIIAFIGRAGSGKDYQCSLLQQKGYKKVAFADVLREMACKTLGMDFDWMINNYDELKVTELYNGQNFRNILENLGSAIRSYNSNFFADALIKKISSSEYINENICISDMRYLNEFHSLYRLNGNISKVKCIFCDYHSERYQHTNNHESAWLANKLCELGHKDLSEIFPLDIAVLEKKYNVNNN